MTDEEKLAAEKLEADKTKVSEYEKELRAENAKLRKDLQAKLKLEEEEKEKALTAQNQFKELSEQRAAKIAELEKSVGEISPYKEKWETFEKTERERLLAKLPEDKRPKFQSADLDILRETVELVENKKSTAEPPGRSDNGDADLNTVPKTMKELVDRGSEYMNNFILKYPEQFGKLQKQHREGLRPH